MEGKQIQCFCLRETKICILGKQPSWGLMNRQYMRRGVALLLGRSEVVLSPQGTELKTWKMLEVQ